MSIESYGKYQLLKRIATGGMAQIFLARERGQNRLLVIKRILPHLADNEEFVQMFLDEARIAARLDHPHIVQIYDLGSQDDSFFIAMEYIHGEDLRRVWKRAERSGQLIPVPFVCRALSEACAGLDHAHKKVDANGKPLNIVHRDISPQNILLTFDGRTKVVDFGIAKAADQATETRSGVLKGKYSYMSPEQAAGEKVDRRSDIFALGVVLYELLTGTRLFKRSNDVITLQAVIECKVLPPSQVNPRVPRDLDPIVMKALEREPGDRYPEAVQLQRALEQWLDTYSQPSSTAHLAAYMKDLYATRLAEEARLGDVLVEEAEAHSPSIAPKSPDRTGRSSIETMAAPRPDAAGVPPRPPRASLSSPRAELDRKRTVDLRRSPGEPTLEASEAGALSETEMRDPGQPSAQPRSHRRAVLGIGAGVLVGLLLGGVWALRSEPVPPPSAPLAPAVVEARPTEPTPAEPEPAKPTPTEPEPAKPALVQVTLKATPAQAALTVDGTPYEKSPVVVSATPGQELLVLARAPRYQELSRKVTVGQGPSQEESLRLEPLPESRKSESRKPDSRVSPQQVERTPVGKGTVRFAVTPWAEVTCGGRNLGSTPLGGDVSFNAGVYECRFWNPDLKESRTERVEVKPNRHTTVVVKF
ncbi:serine/threonine protein kinase [Cystobacter fuscus]|uniref:Serine/threonine protein kinase n=1 Tax=Cystobacter fuscus TaxID=43 RepID=A0A250J1Y1_9BACT|nr:serine/threonine-protein kinase [Cystobacter fuscus]ATB37985.1 serine/threonine protein kinase [Cystobacter fuscus]